MKKSTIAIIILSSIIAVLIITGIIFISILRNDIEKSNIKILELKQVEKDYQNAMQMVSINNQKISDLKSEVEKTNAQISKIKYSDIDLSSDPIINKFK
jgi:hypothetical protein